MDILKTQIIDHLKEMDSDDVKRCLGAATMLLVASHPNGRDMTRNFAALHSDAIGLVARNLTKRYFDSSPALSDPTPGETYATSA